MKKTIVFSALLMIGAFAFAQKGDGSMRRTPPEARFAKDHQRGVIEKLELTEDQQKKMKELRMEHTKKISITKNELKIRKAELEAAIEVEKPDREKVDQLVKEMNDLRGSLFAEHINHQLEARALLDEKQKLKYDQMNDRMFDRPYRGIRGQ